MRLIDADAVIKSIEKQNELLKLLANEHKELIDISNMICVGFKQEIDNAPTVDAVEVVRCRDCKYHSYWCEEFETRTNPDDYCSYGERREVVRCKDCKYCSVDKYADGNAPNYVCIEMDCGVEADNFCSRGERKDETD